jgi:hypothetical protein
MPYCSQCNSPIIAEDRYCRYCGFKIDKKRICKLAIASMSLGIINVIAVWSFLFPAQFPGDVSFFLSSVDDFYFYIILPPLGLMAISFGSISIVQIKRKKNLKGMGFAIAGVWGGSYFIPAFLMVILTLFTVL